MILAAQGLASPEGLPCSDPYLELARQQVGGGAEGIAKLALLPSAASPQQQAHQQASRPPTCHAPTCTGGWSQLSPCLCIAAGRQLAACLQDRGGGRQQEPHLGADQHASRSAVQCRHGPAAEAAGVPGCQYIYNNIHRGAALAQAPVAGHAAASHVICTVENRARCFPLVTNAALH
jgi:hypothetical protein